MVGSSVMPTVKWGGHLIEIAHEIGIHEAKWQDIAAWMQATGARLTPWESEAVKLISAAYSAGVQAYAGKNEPAPYESRQASEDSIRSAIRKRR